MAEDEIISIDQFDSDLVEKSAGRSGKSIWKPKLEEYFVANAGSAVPVKKIAGDLGTEPKFIQGALNMMVKRTEIERKYAGAKAYYLKR